MALGISSGSDSGGGGGGDFTPIAKWDAKSGDFLARNRSQGSDGTWSSDDVEIQTPVEFVADMDNIEVGWISYSPSVDFKVTKIGSAMPPKPSDDYKQGFRLRLYNKELGLRELSSTAKTVVRVLDELHDNYVAEAAANEGKLPLVLLKGGKRVKINTPGGELTFKVPDWSIKSWVARPAEMEAGSSPDPVADEGDIF